MRQKFLFFLCSILIIFSYIQPVFAENSFELNISTLSQLSERKLIWPDWHIPVFLRRPRFQDDLIYPDWFEGVWDVNSKLEGEKNEELIHHSARFIYDSSGRLIGDRQYNTESYALSENSGSFLSVKIDPNSPNRQFAKLTEDRYLETKIIGRLQERINNNIFLTDELTLQILHTPEITRVSEVETLTEFRKCGSDGNIVSESNKFYICGEQFQAIFKEPGQNLISLPIKTQKSKLILSKINYD